MEYLEYEDMDLPHVPVVQNRVPRFEDITDDSRLIEDIDAILGNLDFIETKMVWRKKG